jgi:POT family proton-dependent oligopeptide transporter
MAKFQTAPIPTTGMPPGVPYIIGNEAAERFSYYGMKAILPVFLTQYLLTSLGDPDFMTETQSRETMGWFSAFAYFVPLFGAVLADAVWGKYKTVLYLSLFYCLGHGTLALMDLPEAWLAKTAEPRTLLWIGLLLIGLGAGGIKPCVSANVGDQFGPKNSHLIEKVYAWFYFSINVGSLASFLVIPILLDRYGPGVAFGVPGVLMAVATFVFWLGRHKFVHVPPRGKRFLRDAFTGEGLNALLRLAPIYLFISVFWSLYDQSASAWVVQAGKMDLKFMGIEWLQSQFQVFNPLLILIFSPLFAYAVYPAINRVWKLTPLRKIFLGFLLTAASFAVIARIEAQVARDEQAFLGGMALEITPQSLDLQGSLLAIDESGRPDSARGLVEAIFGAEALAVVQEARGLGKDTRASALPLSEVAAVSARLGKLAADQKARREGELGAAPTKLNELADYRQRHAQRLRSLDVEFSQESRTLRAELESALAALPAGAAAAILATAIGLEAPVDPDAVAGAESERPKWVSAGFLKLKDGQPARPIERPNIVWQLLAYAILTAGEVMVSITALEFAYTQAPLQIKSLVMCLYLLAVSLGNSITALVNLFTADEYGNSTLQGASYYWFFVWLMLGATAVYAVVSSFYRPKTYVRDDAAAGA